MLILTAIPDLQLQPFLHFLLLHTHTHTRENTHIPRERDGSVTIGKQRLLVTENALRREPRQRSEGEEVVGLRLGSYEEGARAASSPSP